MTTHADIRSELNPRTPTSQTLHASAQQVLAMELVGSINLPYPLYIRASKGSRVWDVDGNAYIDLTMGLGPHVLGHAPDVVVEAVKAAAESGLQWALPHPSQEALARLLVEASPSAEKVMFCNSGTEATMYAIRAARAYTGKTKIAFFDGSYHGAHDYALHIVEPKSPRDHPTAVARGAGIPPAVTEQIVLLPYRREAAFDLIRAHKDDLALVMIEPIQSSNPRLDCGGFLRDLATTCREAGVLFLLDEVVTGFRLAYGGGQEYFGVTPDLATYGKALGGGMPMGAVAGPTRIMDVFREDRGDGAEPPVVFAGGTFGGNPIAMAAGIAAVSHLRAHPEIYPYLAEQGARLAWAVNDFCRQEEIPAQILNAASLLYLQFQVGRIEGTRDVTDSPQQQQLANDFYTTLLKYGVLIPGVHLALLSAAHTPADVDHVIHALQQTFLELREQGRI